MFVHEFALLIAIASPIAALCSMHAGLWAAGERDTLMLPLPQAYPAAIQWEMVEEAPAPAPTIPQNEEDFRLAA
jgi:hypothetical protein